MINTKLLAALGFTVAAITTRRSRRSPSISASRPSSTPTPLRPATLPRSAPPPLRSDAVSIESSRIALERSRNPNVRNYAKNVLVEREATTKALLPEGTSLTAGGTVVSDSQPFETRFDNPVGVVLAPVTISATIASTDRRRRARRRRPRRQHPR